MVYFSATIIFDFIDYATLKGADSVQLKREFLIQKEQKLVSYDMVIKVLNHIGQELNDEYLGLHIGEQMTLKATAYVDNIVQHSETLENAFNNAVYYSRLISDALDCKLVKNENKYSVLFEENPNWAVHKKNAKKQILDLTLLSCLNSLITYTGKNYYPTKIYFQTEKPNNLKEYYRLFNCSLKFNHPRTEIIFEKQIFDSHDKQIQFGLLENLKKKVEKEIDLLTTENELIYQLKKIILNHKPERILIEDASSKLNLSKRTLQRKLNNLDTSFKKIEHELLLKLAKTYLEEKQKTINEISYLLGFSESSVFIRFFKSLTNLTPTKYKNNVSN